MTEPTLDFSAPMPLFPLADCVLLPHVMLPLHIFEPRYRQMIGDALDGQGAVAMALFSRVVDPREYLEGNPPLRPCAGVGVVSNYERLPDGRYVILLEGVARARIVSEVPSPKPYRQVLLHPLAGPGHPATLLDEWRNRLLGMDTRTMPGKIRPRFAALKRVGATLPVEALLDRMASELLTDTDEKYAMLEEADPVRRAEALFLALARPGAPE